MRTIIFLDIDGVLIAYPEGGGGTSVFTPRCVAAFKSIVAAVPAARVVFATTWRLPRYVDQLHAQWLENGLPAGLAVDATPDLRFAEGVGRLHLRGYEIRRWLEANPDVSRWVVIDDERLAIEPVLGARRCVFTDPAHGLTEMNAAAAIGILAGEPAWLG